MTIHSKEVKLREHQIDHYQRIEHIFGYAPCAIDSSRMGQGKTMIALKYAQDHNLRLLIVCDVTLKHKIARHAEEYGLISPIIMTYNKLRGNSLGSETSTNDGTKVANVTVKHPYLIYKDGQYFPTQALVDLIQSGVLVVFDEYQALKNKSLQYYAALSLVRSVAAYRTVTPSRAFYLSETGCDNVKSIENVVTLLCLTYHNQLVRTECNGKIVHYDGYNDIVQIARSISPDKTLLLVPADVSIKSAFNVVYALYVNILKYYYSSSMPELAINHTRDFKSCYYSVPDGEAHQLATHIKTLEKNVRYLSDGTAIFQNIDRSTSTNILRMIELAKIPLFKRVIREALDARNNCKVIMAANYLDTVAALQDHFREEQPLVMTGAHKDKERDQIINLFQNDDSRRLLIVSQVGRVGVDLDDQDGDKPRILFISPCYSFIKVGQMIGRVFRLNTKSDVIVRLVYAHNSKYQSSMHQELRILQALHRKEKITIEMSTNRSDASLFEECEAIYEDGTPIDLNAIVPNDTVFINI